MDDDLLSIGTFARASGLSVSALRFYDKVGVLVPAVVDAATGYRRYHPSQLPAARLVAGMRRISMPLAEIGVVLEQRTDREAVEQILTDHLRRLEDGLADARREVERLRSQLLRPEAGRGPGSGTVRVPAGSLLRALDTVRHAVGSDPDFPVLAGILVELGHDLCRLVATDRYRLAVAAAPIVHEDNVIGDASTQHDAEGPAPVGGLVLPVEAAEQVRELLARHVAARPSPDGNDLTAVLRLTHEHVELRVGGDTVRSTALVGDFPDYRRLLHDLDAPRTETVGLDRLRGQLTDLAPARHTDEDLVALGHGDGGIGLLGSAADGPAVVVNREFLLQAAESIPQGQLHLDLDGPIAPLVIRSEVDEHTLSLLMPVRPEP